MGNRVLVRPKPPEESQSEGGIWLPRQVEEHQQGAVLGEVLATGPDVEYLEVGTIVILSQHVGDFVLLMQNLFVLLEEPAVLATVEEDEDGDEEAEYYNGE